MPTDNIESISKHTGDAGFRSIEECLKDCLEDCGKQGSFKDGKKVLVLCLDDTAGEYKVSWSQAGMKMSECVALCEVSKQLFLNEMNYNLMPHNLEY